MAHGPFTLSAASPSTDWVGTPQGVADVVAQITGTWTGTVTFEAATEGNEAAATPLAMSALATPGTLVTTAVANGVFKTQNGWAGGLKVRARFSTPTSGNPVVTLQTADAR